MNSVDCIDWMDLSLGRYMGTVFGDTSIGIDWTTCRAR